MTDEELGVLTTRAHDLSDQIKAHIADALGLGPWSLEALDEADEAIGAWAERGHDAGVVAPTELQSMLAEQESLSRRVQSELRRRDGCA